MIKNIEEIKKEFTDKEILDLKEHYSKKYKNDYTIMTNEKFLNWMFIDYEYYFKNIYISYKNGLNTSETYVANNNRYINIKIYENRESNLNLWNIILEGYYIQFKDKETLLSFYDELISNGIINTELLNTLEFKFLKYKESKWVEEFSFETVDDFYGNYIENNKEFCKGALIKNNDYLNTYSIYLYGNDDYSITTDFFTEQEAKNLWFKLKKMKTIKKDDLVNHYFSN